MRRRPPAGDASAAKPLRSQAPAVRRMLAVAQRTRRVVGGRAPGVAAALLAQADTAVHLLVFGDCRDDPATLGADVLIQAQAPAAHAPDLALAALLAEIAGDPPLHIFMSDEDPDDADLAPGGAHRLRGGNGRGLAERRRSLAHGGPGAARPLPLPRILLLAADAVDDALPWLAVACAARSPGRRRPRAIANRRASLDAAELALEEADLIVSAGNGVRDLESFRALAAALGAAVGASRVPVDDGRFPRSQQIGATGKTVSASLYLAFGISGAVQHLQGIKDCRHVIAVNLDASAPLIKRADLSIIDDAHSVTRALLAEVAGPRGRAHSAGDAPWLNRASPSWYRWDAIPSAAPSAGAATTAPRWRWPGAWAARPSPCCTPAIRTNRHCAAIWRWARPASRPSTCRATGTCWIRLPPC